MAEAIASNLALQSTQVSVTGSAARLATPLTGTPHRSPYSGVTIKALSANTQTVYVGGSDVSTSKGTPLAAGESLYVGVADLSQVYAVSASGTQTLSVCWVGVAP